MISIQLVAFFLAGVYRGEWHYFGLKDAVTVLKGVALGVSGVALLYGYFNDPRLIFVNYALLVLIFTIAARGSLRIVGSLLRS